MNLQKIFEMLQIKYTYAVSQDWIEKPLAYALYHVWRYVDAHERNRRKTDGDRIKTVSYNG